MMRDIVIIGGGLGGLSAAYELERQGVPYRLIEVKKRLGGSIFTETRDGFVMDGGAFAHDVPENWPLLAELGLTDALFPVWSGSGEQRFAFRQGTGALVDALTSHLKGSILRRMAVSSLGEWNGRFTLCMENGLMLEAGALIVAAPARHVERMFRTLQPEISQRLFEYPYDSIMRVALGVRADEYKSPGRRAWDMAVAYFYETDHPDRMPPDHRLIHLGIRLKPEQITAEALLALLKERLRLPEITASLIAHWPDADSLAVRERAALAVTLNGLLPEGIALVGSDYVAGGLAERVEQGREAARQIAAWAQSAG